MMRELTVEDLPILDEIHKRCHSFPVPNIKKVLDDKVIVSDRDGSIVGYALVKMFPEMAMVLDTSKPVRERIAALNEFLKRTIEGCKLAALEQLHVFVEDDRLAEFLKENYNFIPAKGTPLVLSLE